MSEFHHIPVLAEESIDALSVKPGGVYLDATVGGGGHSYLIAERLGETGHLICLDRDDEALDAARARLSVFQKNITFVKSNFIDIASVLEWLGISQIDGVLFDLGVSSHQLDDGERGFSYTKDAPLDMRMDRTQSLDARTVINEYSQEQLRTILTAYGEERYASLIASAVTRERSKKPIETTLELAEIVKSAVPPSARKEKQHPAKRTFQAVRIEVNGELEAIRRGVSDAIACLSCGGRIAVISFHSLEDRIIKRTFASQAQGCTCPKEFPICVCGNVPKIKLISKGVITPSQEELVHNPRSRSAKLRVAEKL